MQAHIQEFLDIRWVQDRDHRIHERVFGLVRRGGGFAGMVVAGQDQDAAILRSAGHVGMAEDIAGPVDAGALSVPHGEDTIDLGARIEADLLRSPDRRRGQILVHPGLEMDVALFQEFFARARAAGRTRPEANRGSRK